MRVSTRLTLAILPFLSTNSYAQEFMIETDPMPFLYDGSDQTIAVRPSSQENWVLWMARFEMDLPEDMIDLVPDNADKGFKHLITPSLGIAADYNFDDQLNGAYFGAGMFRINNHVTFEGRVNAFKINYYFLRTGYRWFPFDNGFYFNFWISAGYQNIIDGSNTFTSSEGQMVEYKVENWRILGGPHFGIVLISRSIRF